MTSNIYGRINNDRLYLLCILCWKGGRIYTRVSSPSSPFQYNIPVQYTELNAIRKEIEWIIRNRITEATIYTDSQSSVRTLSDKSSRNALVQEVIWNYQEYRLRLVIPWVKSHSGTKGNERADRLGVEERKLPLVYENCKILKSYNKKLVRKVVLIRWQQKWDGESKGRDTYTLVAKASYFHWDIVPEIVYLLTGHEPFPT